MCCILETIEISSTEQFSAMRDLMIKNGDGFLLVYSIIAKSSFNDLNDFIDQIYLVKDKENVPLIIVGNKIDLEDQRVITKNELEEFANKKKLSFIETSAKNSINIQESFIQLIRLIFKSEIPSKQKKEKRIVFYFELIKKKKIE